ncbi:hypothetical protein Tco_1038817 [Tanacetum coccineum]
MLRLCHRLIACSIVVVTVTDLFYLRGMDVGSVNISYLLARYLRLFASGRKHGEMISGGQFVARLICVGLKDTWAWVAPGLERQQVATAGAPEATEDAPVVDEGAPAVPAPVQAPQPPPPAASSDYGSEMAGGISQLVDSAGATHVPNQRRRVKQRTDGASTSTAQ